MPGQHRDEERERKERIKKLKTKTSKMRLANIEDIFKDIDAEGAMLEKMMGKKRFNNALDNIDKKNKSTSKTSPKKKSKSAAVKKENNPTDIKESKPDSKSGKPCATCGKKSSDESYSCIHDWLGC